MPRGIVAIAIVAVLGGGAYLFRDRISGAVDQLVVGDCFDQPAAAMTEVEEVQHRPCTESHTAEVFHVFDHQGAADRYPTDNEWGDAVFPVCDSQFLSYTGSVVTPTGVLDYSMFTPTEEGWRTGDREVTCFLFRTDGEAMMQSHRAATN